MNTKEKIKNWYKTNNRHESDDRRLFDIVISSLDKKIEEDVFEDALTDANADISEDEFSEVYKRYELQRSCLIYYIDTNPKQ